MKNILKYFNTTNLILLIVTLLLVLFLLIIINKDKKILKIFSKVTIIIGIINLVACLFIGKFISTILASYYMSILSIPITDNINKIMLINSGIYIGLGILTLIIYKILNKKHK